VFTARESRGNQFGIARIQAGPETQLQLSNWNEPWPFSQSSTNIPNLAKAGTRCQTT
jgi:hypothetical protein